MRQGGGNRFGEDDLGDPKADALTNNGQGPPSITGRLRSAADGAQAAADLVGAGAAGLAAAQLIEAVGPKRLHLLLRNFARCAFHAPALGARVAQLRDLAVHCLRQPAHVPGAAAPSGLAGVLARR